MGCKRLSDEDERKLVDEYLKGVAVKQLMIKYGFASKKSITDKVKKYYPNYKEMLKQAKENRKTYSLDLSKIDNPFNAYLIGLLLTDGYIIDNNKFGLQLTDEDCIRFISEATNNSYYSYETEGHKTEYRIVFSGSQYIEQLKRYNITTRKSYTVKGFDFYEDEIKYIPFLIRGIIDGDGCIHKTTKGSVSFYICSMSYDFILWIQEILEKRFFMEDTHIKQSSINNIWIVETSLQTNIFKLMAIVYDRPYGMSRKYNCLREMFRDYNKSNQQNFIWNDVG